MALWVCGGEAGCGTKYAVGLFRCPRCHNTAFHEDGDPMAKITRHGGASDATLPETDTDDVEPAPDPEPEDVPAVEPETDTEGGDGPSLGSSSSASTETPEQKPEPSEQPTPSPAPTTGSRSSKGRTARRSASGTDGGQETGTSATADE
jgi:hypothetical protein